MTTKAVSYLRVSGKGQIDGDGFPRQRDAVARYAKANGLELVAEFRDEGVGGDRELDDRGGLSDLMARIRSNGVRIVLVERADRLARDLMVGEVILSEFRKMAVCVIAADSGTDLADSDGDPTRTLIRQVLGAVAQFEKSVLVSKLKAARIRKRRETGRCEGVRPYGSLHGEAATVALMRKLHRKPRGGTRLTFGQIAGKLNDLGVAPRRAEKWSAETIRAILAREHAR